VKGEPTVKTLRDTLTEAWNALFALLAVVLACAMLVAFGAGIVAYVRDANVVVPVMLGIGLLVLAVAARVLSRIDEYEYVPVTTTTRRGGTRRRPTRKATTS
jgi:hypothetical protein